MVTCCYAYSYSREYSYSKTPVLLMTQAPTAPPAGAEEDAVAAPAVAVRAATPVGAEEARYSTL